VKRWAAGLFLLLALVASCSDDNGDERGASRPSSLSGTLTVLAASSLTEAFAQIGDDFEQENPDVDVDVSFAASSELAAQIQQGAPADVFASADEANMQKVVDSGDVADTPTVFARNRLEIAVEEGNPEDIAGLHDLDRRGLVVILCAEQVPCGKFADQALAKAGVRVTPASGAENVKAALAPVELGEADAAIVYVTDVEASDQIDGVQIAAADNVIATYPIATLAESSNRAAANAFVTFVGSAQGQRVLRQFGFLAP
jgi:molybdate transport system substrate-binding protein